MTTLPQNKTAFPAQPPRTLTGVARRGGLLNRLAKPALLRSLDSLQSGQLELVDGLETHRTPRKAADDLQATVCVHDPAFYSHVIQSGGLGAAEAYLRGMWTCDDLTTLLRIFARNLSTAHNWERGWGRVAKWAARWGHALRANTRRGAKRNIHEHYDLGNDFFELFLDPSMQYSSAIFENDSMTLADASVAKMDRICRKLGLTPNDHLLEIGTGWGGLAEYAAKNYGCRVTSATISREQYEYATDRMRRADLGERVKVLLTDYRDLQGQYDKLVSVEMIEAVGSEYFGTFFEKCGQLLKPDGLMLLQAITIPDERFERYLRSVDFIQRYIFPGGCLPSVGVMKREIAQRSDMSLLHLEDFSSSYAQTLNIWRRNFFRRLDAVRELGFTERFIRMWEYYFCYCEAGFRESATGVAQMLLARPQARIKLSHLSPE